MRKKSKRIPITAAKNMATHFKKDQIIIFGWDRANGITTITTYGATKEDCQQAAEGGNRIAEFLGLMTPQVEAAKDET